MGRLHLTAVFVAAWLLACSRPALAQQMQASRDAAPATVASVPRPQTPLAAAAACRLHTRSPRLLRILNGCPGSLSPAAWAGGLRHRPVPQVYGRRGDGAAVCAGLQGASRCGPAVRRLSAELLSLPPRACHHSAAWLCRAAHCRCRAGARHAAPHSGDAPRKRHRLPLLPAARGGASGRGRGRRQQQLRSQPGAQHGAPGWRPLAASSWLLVALGCAWLCCMQAPRPCMGPPLLLACSLRCGPLQTDEASLLPQKTPTELLEALSAWPAVAGRRRACSGGGVLVAACFRPPGLPTLPPAPRSGSPLPPSPPHPPLLPCCPPIRGPLLLPRGGVVDLRAVLPKGAAPVPQGPQRRAGGAVRAGPLGPAGAAGARRRAGGAPRGAAAARLPSARMDTAWGRRRRRTPCLHLLPTTLAMRPSLLPAPHRSTRPTCRVPRRTWPTATAAATPAS